MAEQKNTELAKVLTADELKSATDFESFFKDFTQSPEFNQIIETIGKAFSSEEALKALENKIDSVLANKVKIVQGLNGVLKWCKQHDHW